MKWLAANFLYLVVGAAIAGMMITCLVGLQWLFERAWALYTEQYFFAANRTIVAIVGAAGCWWWGKQIVESWTRR